MWLRNLTHHEAGGALATLERGKSRPLADATGSPAREAGATSKPPSDRPYAHPYFWAAFILIGDPT